MKRANAEKTALVRREHRERNTRRGDQPAPGDSPVANRDGHGDRRGSDGPRQSPGVCVCPSCGCTEAQVSLTPCHEHICPLCGQPMRQQ
jgi:hypothetical protein